MTKTARFPDLRFSCESITPSSLRSLSSLIEFLTISGVSSVNYSLGISKGPDLLQPEPFQVSDEVHMRLHEK